MALAMKRRGVFFGLAGLLAAPAVVRAQSLMLISPTDIYRGGLLTPQQITDEMARLVRRNLARRGVAGWAPEPPYHLARAVTQQHVDFCVPSMDLALSIQQFRERWLEPAAHGLVDAMPVNGRAVASAIPMPPNVQATAISEAGGLGLRFMRHYDLFNDRVFTRFDVRSVT